MMKGNDFILLTLINWIIYLLIHFEDLECNDLFAKNVTLH